ncbi:MAG: alpha-amylase family glycosyl hydrolase [Actinomycetota bacterium]|nr:alpha-amylase family glycosyl hydrolase [Actinomycetota bacterium]
MTAGEGSAAGERWWEGAALYQVYVRSWQDSDGDGYGDLAGVRRRLDHLSWLGIDGLWLSPTMPSPDEDWGYDVADYYGVHPELGTLEELDRLVAEAAQRGIRVLLDLVPNHTSSLHPWFVEARSSREAPHRDWYVWADPGPDGGPPNNWRSAAGGSAWTLDEGSGQYYLHNFLPGQPDLNWWNEEVHAELGRVLRYWFDRGVAGFRIDVAHSLYKDRQLRDDSPAPKGPAAPFGLAADRSMNQPEAHEVYRAWRKLAGEYRPARLLLGETWVFDAQRLASFYGDDDELHLAFNFPFVFAPFRAAELSSIVASTLAALPPGACPVWVGSNHDVSRLPTRWGAGDPARARTALVLLCTLPGTVVLYYGDELGLTDVPVPPDEQRDPMSWRAPDDRFNRDRARTPMPWEPGPLYGFAPRETRPWLPAGDRDGLTVAEQREDPASTLSLTRALLDLRRQRLTGHTAGDVAGYEQLPSGRDQWVYRSGPLVVAANLAADEVQIDVPAGEVIISSAVGVQGGGVRVGRRPADPALVLGPFEAVVIQPHEAAG